MWMLSRLVIWGKEQDSPPVLHWKTQFPATWQSICDMTRSFPGRGSSTHPASIGAPALMLSAMQVPQRLNQTPPRPWDIEHSQW